LSNDEVEKMKTKMTGKDWVEPTNEAEKEFALDQIIC